MSDQVRKLLIFKCKQVIKWSAHRNFDTEFIKSVMELLVDGDELTTLQIKGIETAHTKCCNLGGY